MQERKLLKRINGRFKDIQRNGAEGIGKHGPPKDGFHWYWFRRINDEHRLVNRIAEDEIRVVQCRYHCSM